MTCQTCNGAGHIRGHWMPELCPACNGDTNVQTYEPEAPMHDIAKFQLWLALGEIAVAVLLVAFACTVFYVGWRAWQ